MKKMKKIMALVLALVLCTSMSVAVFATEPTTPTTYKITITANANNDEHTYAAYQIMTGDLDSDTQSATYGQLQNLAWATGVEGQTLLDALKADSTIGGKFVGCDGTAASVAAALAKCTGADDVEALVAVIGAYVTSANLSVAGTSSNNVISGLTQGYYFVKDITNDDTLTYDTKSQYMLQVVGDVTVKAKDSAVSLEKHVDDVNDSSDGTNTITWQDTADYDVGDTIPYMLKGTLPSNYAKFDFFDYAFSDRMSNGLTLNADSVKVVYYENADALTEDTNATEGTDITDYFTITPNSDTAGATLSVSISSAFSDESGVVTDTGLKKIPNLTASSVIVVYYTATLNENAVIGGAGNDNTATLTFSNNPNATGDGDNTTTTTPQDKNIVFTYKVDVNKFNEKNEPLEGATFALYKKVANADTVGANTGAEIKNTLGDDVKADALDDEIYYVTVGSIEAIKAEGATNYTASFSRVDDGDYVLVETVVPTGYNAWDAKSFTISATHTQDPNTLELTELKATGGLIMDGNISTGSMSTDIVNNSGSVLPSTGGMGTTIFYIVGAILVVGAGILLVTRRRMNAQ